MTRRFNRRLKSRRAQPKTNEEIILDLARKSGELCPTCGYFVNPQGCCNPSCEKYSGVPF